MKRKAEMRAAAKMAAEGDPQNEDDTETIEKADRLRAMVRIKKLVNRNILSSLNAQWLTQSL